MKVNFYATLRLIAGAKTIELEPKGTAPTVRALLRAALERFPEMEAKLFDHEGNLLPQAHLFVNGENARYLKDGLDSPVRDGDQIDFFPAVGGG